MASGFPPRIYGALGAVASLLVAAILSGAPPAAALVHFGFEGPYLVDPGHTVKDHALYFDGALWHCFYIRGAEGQGTSSEDSLGHATSPDLRNWTILPPALGAGPKPWDSRNVWAPAILGDDPSQPGRVLMLYTGADGQVVQRMGMASADPSAIQSWTKFGDNPQLEPDSTVYAWSPSAPFSAFRDPFYFFEGGVHHLLHTVRLRDSTLAGGARGAVHHLVSSDFQTWSDAGPLLVHNGPSSVAWHEIESVQLRHEVGRWHLFFSETNIGGIRYLQSTQMDAGWDLNAAVTFDLGIAPETTSLPAGGYLFSRHAVASHLLDGSLFWVLRVDSLRFDAQSALPFLVRTDAMAADWPVRTGSSFVAAPTFGDNSLERGEAPTAPVGHGYLSSREFYAGPLSGKGTPGASLGGGATGTLKSRTFLLQGDYLDLLVGGGDDPLCFVALVDAATDSILFEARGTGPPTLQSVRWPIWQLRGRSAYVWVEDASTAVNGYINVDEIREVIDPTPAPPAAPPLPARRAQLLPNVPNPFNPATTLRAELAVRGTVQLLLFDLRGRRIRAFPAAAAGPGRVEQRWDGTDDGGRPVSSGVYRLVLLLDGRREAQRLLQLVR